MKPLYLNEVDVDAITVGSNFDHNVFASEANLKATKRGIAKRIRVTKHLELIDGDDILLAHKYTRCKKISVGVFDYHGEIAGLWNLEDAISEVWGLSLRRCCLITDYMMHYQRLHPETKRGRSKDIKEPFHRFPNYGDLLGKRFGVCPQHINASVNTIRGISEQTRRILRAIPEMSMKQLVKLGKISWDRQAEVAQNLVDGIIKFVRQSPSEVVIQEQRVSRLTDLLEHGNLGKLENLKIRRDCENAVGLLMAAKTREKEDAVMKGTSPVCDSNGPIRIKANEEATRRPLTALERCDGVAGRKAAHEALWPKQGLRAKSPPRRVFKPLPTRNMFDD